MVGYLVRRWNALSDKQEDMQCKIPMAISVRVCWCLVYTGEFCLCVYQSEWTRCLLLCINNDRQTVHLTSRQCTCSHAHRHSNDESEYERYIHNNKAPLGPPSNLHLTYVFVHTRTTSTRTRTYGWRYREICNS